MQGYYVRIGEKEIGPFLTKSAAASEAKELKGKGYECKVIARTVSEQQMFEHLGNPEAEVDIDDDELDLDSLFDDEEEGDDEGDEKEGDDDEEEGDDDDDEEGDKKPKEKDKKPTGEHGWYRSFGSKG